MFLVADIGGTNARFAMAQKTVMRLSFPILKNSVMTASGHLTRH